MHGIDPRTGPCQSPTVTNPDSRRRAARRPAPIRESGASRAAGVDGTDSPLGVAGLAAAIVRAGRPGPADGGPPGRGCCRAGPAVRHKARGWCSRASPNPVLGTGPRRAPGGRATRRDRHSDRDPDRSAGSRAKCRFPACGRPAASRHCRAGHRPGGQERCARLAFGAGRSRATDACNPRYTRRRKRPASGRVGSSAAALAVPPTVCRLCGDAAPSPARPVARAKSEDPVCVASTPSERTAVSRARSAYP